MFTIEELTLFVEAVDGILGCNPDWFIDFIEARMDYVCDPEFKEGLINRLSSLPKTDLAELACRCEDFWKSNYKQTPTLERLFDVGLPQNFGVPTFCPDAL